jgi:hypothetical protein
MAPRRKDPWLTEGFLGREIGLSVGSFKQEVLAIAAVLAALLLGLAALWLADEMTNRFGAAAVAIVLAVGLTSHGRRQRIP